MKVETSQEPEGLTSNEVLERLQVIMGNLAVMEATIVRLVPHGRERSLALTNLQQGALWARAALEALEVEDDDE